MQAGTYISGAGHGALLLSLLADGWMGASPPPLNVASVSLISSEEFAALTPLETAPETAPETLADITPVAPAPRPADQRVEAPEPLDAGDPDLDDAPDAPNAPPEPEPAEDPPEQPQPPEPPAQEIAALAPPSDTPAPLDAPRVAPLPAPDREAPKAPAASNVPLPRVSPDADTLDKAEEAPSAAPREATTAIVTEAETPASAPAVPPHPVTRPVRQAEEPEAPAASGIEEAIEAAVADAISASDAPVGPPLSGSEKEGFVIAVQECWNVDPVSEAARVTVDIGFSMNRDGTVVVPSIRFLGATEGSDAAIKSAYEKGRRAIIRCGSQGYPLPADKFDHWREVEMTFNPERMRLK